MGLRNYLIEGVSGAGKTSVATELERRGYHVIHGDRVLAYHGDPETGEALSWPAGLSEPDRMAWGHAHWIWPVDKVRALVADHTAAMSFFCGGSRNWRQFIDLFDLVFVLEVDLETLKQRLVRRADDEFGGRPIERDLVVRLHASRQDIPPDATSIDATAPLAQLVDDILAKCATPS